METERKTEVHFGKGRVWLNPTSNDCKAGVVWHVDITIYHRDDKEDVAYLEAYFTSTEECGNHWVYKRGDLAPMARLNGEISKFQQACKQAFKYIEDNDLNYNGD